MVFLRVFLFFVFTFSCSYSEEEWDTNRETSISVTMSRNEMVSYINVSPLYYQSRRKNHEVIDSSKAKARKFDLKPMELILYTRCNRTDPSQTEHYNPDSLQVMQVSFLLAKHPYDPSAAYYLGPVGLFRIFKSLLFSGGEPFFKEKGQIRLSSEDMSAWPVDISRENITAGGETDYSISFSDPKNQRDFIQSVILNAGEKPSRFSIILKSPGLYVEATYPLIYKGFRNYQPVKSINIIKWWNKQLISCPKR